MSKKLSFFAELKRRNVYKVALTYAVVSWLLIAVASILLPIFEAPGWMIKTLVALLALGFALAVFVSWNFEMTPEGMKRTQDLSPGDFIPYWSRRKFATFIISAAVIAFGLSAYQLLRLMPAFQQVSGGKRTDKIFIQGNPAGMQTVERQADGAMRAEYSYNDRGRGDHITATWKLDGAGVPIEYDGHGNDYMKAPIEEHFEIKDGRASWKNRSEQGDQPVAAEGFYLPMNGPPEFFAVLARALLKAPNHKLPLLPVGEPGTAVSPGTNICSFTKAPALTLIDALVLLAMAAWVTSDAVTVALLAVLSRPHGALQWSGLWATGPLVMVMIAGAAGAGAALAAGRLRIIK